MAKKRKALTLRVPPPETVPPPWVKVPLGALERSRLLPRKRELIPNAYLFPQFPKRSLPPKADTMAMDDMVVEINAWAAQEVYNGAFFEGLGFLGYTYLTELAQRPEYRRITEVLATAATGEWIDFNSTATDNSKEARIAELRAEFDRLHVQDVMRRVVEIDGFFGRAHLYLDTGSTDDRAELITPIGDGKNDITKTKFAKPGFLERLQPVEPVWCYPAQYNANDPLRPDWYKPQSWFVQGKQIHASRLLTFVGREVPDMLKPAYAFGGLSLSQLAKPYVDNWLRTRQAVADLTWSFSVSGLKSDLNTLLQADGEALFRRAELFNNLRNNRGMMLLNKDSEEFFNISTPLSTLDALQAQAQEHMCSVTGTPVVVLLGIQPAGLNASSEGEIRTWERWVRNFQEKFLREKIMRVMNFAMLNLWGECDPGITFAFKPLRSLDELAMAQVRKVEAETADILIASAVISPEDERARLAADPDSPYHGLDVNDLPEPIEGPEDIDIRGTQRPAAVLDKEKAAA